MTKKSTLRFLVQYRADTDFSDECKERQLLDLQASQIYNKALYRTITLRNHQHQMLSGTKFFCSFLMMLALAGCRSLPPSKPAAQWTPEEARGAQVFQRNCARCHYPTTTRPLNGPGLQAITKVKAMPSGAPPTEERMTEVILHGRLMMPATQLTDDQLQDLLAYLHTL